MSAFDNSHARHLSATFCAHVDEDCGQSEDAMADYHVRPLEPSDFETLMALEQSLFGDKGEKTLGPFYVRLCCDFFNETCFLGFSGREPVGYMFSFVRGREAYCSTLAVMPAHQRTRLVLRLVNAFVTVAAAKVDSLWFTVHESNLEARSLHATLGARELGLHEAYFGPGEPRIMSRIDRAGFDKLCARMARLGLMAQPAVA